jgi:hypothetical protein
MGAPDPTRADPPEVSAEDDARIEAAMMLLPDDDACDWLHRSIVALRKTTGCTVEEALDQTMPIVRPDWATEREVKVRHAALSARAFETMRAHGWEPQQPAACYEAVAEAGFYAKTLPLACVAFDILAEQQPKGVRGLLYKLVSAGWIPSTADAQYDRVDRLSVKLRKRGVVPYEWIVDDLRVRLKPSSWSGLVDFGETVRAAYRKDFWEHLPVYIEFFVEKAAMAATLQEMTDNYDVALNPIRGMSSLSALYEVGQLWRQIQKPIHAYYLGDHDPSGLQIEKVARETLASFSQRDFSWTRLAVLPDHLDDYDLLRLPPKKKDPNLRRFLAQGHHDCAELDAIEATELRRLVREAIEQHLPEGEWERLLHIEDLERKSFNTFFEQFFAGEPSKGG